jgi:hypothetical protein
MAERRTSREVNRKRDEQGREEMGERRSIPVGRMD